jgi:hypothetical protein
MATKPSLGESVVFVDLTVFSRLKDSIPGSSGAVPKGFVKYDEAGKTESWHRLR